MSEAYEAVAWRIHTWRAQGRNAFELRAAVEKIISQIDGWSHEIFIITNVCHTWKYVCHNEFESLRAQCFWITRRCSTDLVTWLINLWYDLSKCDMTHQFVVWLIQMWHDSSICDMTYPNVTWLVWWHASSIIQNTCFVWGSAMINLKKKVKHLSHMRQLKKKKRFHVRESAFKLRADVQKFVWHYCGVATISRLLKIIGLFCKRAPEKRQYLQKRPIILRSLLIVATPYPKGLLIWLVVLRCVVGCCSVL